MKFIKKKAESIAIMYLNGHRVVDYRCPNIKCGMGISDDYAYCPYCGQKVYFVEPSKTEEYKEFRKTFISK